MTFCGFILNSHICNVSSLCCYLGRPNASANVFSWHVKSHGYDTVGLFLKISSLCNCWLNCPRTKTTPQRSIGIMSSFRQWVPKDLRVTILLAVNTSTSYFVLLIAKGWRRNGEFHEKDLILRKLPGLNHVDTLKTQRNYRKIILALPAE